MPAIILPGKYRQPPTGPVELDRHHPFTEGLLIYVLPAGGTQLIDYANRTGKKSIPLSLGTGGISAANGFAGPAIKGSNAGGTAIYDWGANPYPWNEPTRAVTVFAYSERIGNATFNAPLIGCFSASSAQYMLYDADGTGDIRFITSAGGWAAASGGAGSYVNGKAHLYVGRYDGAALTVWRDNVKLGTTAFTGNLPTDAANHGAIFNYAETGLSRTPNALLFAGGVYNRALSDADIAQLADNPFQLIRPVSGRIYFFPSAGGGGATITGALESLTLSTFGATVGSARAVAATLESLALTTSAARVSSDRAITASVESISITTSPARIASDRAVAAATEQLTVTPAAASVALVSGIAAGTEALSVTANPATVALAASIAATLEAITVTGLTATVSTSSDTNISAALESITVTVNPATVSRDSALAAALESLTVTPHAASIAVGQIVAAALESLTLTSYPAGIALDVAIAGGLEQINLTTLAAQVGLGSNVAALVEAITLTEFGATLTMTGEIAAALESIGLTTFVATVVGGESALTTPGLEFTIPVGRMHYAIPIGRIHFTIPRD